MKKGLLFIGIVVTSMVMLFATNAAMSFPRHSPAIKNEIGQLVSVYRISEPGLPFDRSQDENAPVYKATPSFSAHSSTYFVRLPQQGLYTYLPLFASQKIKKRNIREPSAPHSLLMILFRDVISPNAP